MPEAGPAISCKTVDAEKTKEQVADILQNLRTDEGRRIFLRHVLLETELPIPGTARPLAEDMVKEEIDRANDSVYEGAFGEFGGIDWQPLALSYALIMAKRAALPDKIEEIEGRLKRLVEKDMHRGEGGFEELAKMFFGEKPKKEETKESLEKLLEVLLFVNPERAFEAALKLGKNDLAKKLATNKVFLDWEKKGEFRRIADACGQMGDTEKAGFYASVQELLDKHGHES